MNTLKTISWEGTKLILIITCIVILCCNMFFMAKFNEVDRGIDVLYSDIHDHHLEILNILKEK